MQVSSVPLGWLVSIALLVLLGEAIAVVLLVLNIAMRKIKWVLKINTLSLLLLSWNHSEWVQELFRIIT